MRVVNVVLIAVVVCATSASAALVYDSGFAYNLAIPNSVGAGLTFNAAGDLYVYDFNHPASQNGCLFKFPGAANLPFGSQIPFSYNGSCVASGGAHVNLGFSGLTASATGRLYLTVGYELDKNTGAVLRRTWENCGGYHGIALSPVDGSMIFADYLSRRLFRVSNPDNQPSTTIQDPCPTPFTSTNSPGVGSGIDGVTIGPDGTVYAAAYESSELFLYNPSGTMIGRSHSGGSGGFGPDGISICVGDGVSFAITADAGRGRLSRFNLTGPGGAPIYAASALADFTGGYNDWTAVDPHGCIWVSTINGGGGIYRLSNADGSCMQCNQPQQPPVPHQGCPNCSEEQSVTWQNLPSETHSATGQGNCISLKFQ